jgi:hypothetical protein
MNSDPVYSHEYLTVCYTVTVILWDPIRERPEAAYVSQFINMTLLFPLFHKITSE